MYTPRHFSFEDVAQQRRLLEQHPLALLLTAGPDGLPISAHLPMVWVDDENGGARLEGHLARANPMLAALQDGQRISAVFTGPDGYVSPAHYESERNVPTWNYLALEFRGRLRLVDDALHKDRLLKRLIAPRDPGYIQQWMGLPEDFQGKLLGAIVGVVLEIESVQAKAKLSQNRSLGEREALIRHFEAQGQASLAQWMRALGPNQQER